MTREIKSKFIKKLDKSKNLINKFITLDIETFVKDNVLIPYCISIYDGKKSYSFGLWDYETHEMMIIDCLKSIMIRKYNRYNIYIHNMAKFDIIFLLKYLVKLGEVKPIIHNGRLISVNFTFGENLEYGFQFKDSYLILLASLDKLTKGFGVKTVKSIFPHFFINETNLDYIGEVPDIKFFNKINPSDYNNYKKSFNNNWNLKYEVVKYCEIDCISLYQVITKFSNLIFSLFSKNIDNYPTLPSLAFAIFRSNFMDENSIPQISGQISKNIRKGYTGGAVDVYIPENPNGVKLYGYDVNALYPSQMQKWDMPVGNVTYFNGDITKIDVNAFGFFYCRIETPNDIKHPIIQTHVKINNTTRTVAPIGIWEDMIFSEELNNAKKYGYKF
uniref:Probable DNA polymerase n=1 Tax=Russula abietina TaxID=482377 RepID=A0A2S0U3Q7_9AGAM|nr:hypothetical protein [Russula abietina]AWB36132.1 hypothetical protein [Russula abietina]